MQPQTHNIPLPAHLAADNAEAFMAALMLSPLEPQSQLVLDASKAESIGASGAQVLVALEKTVRSAQAELHITAPTAPFSQALNEMGMGFLITLFR